MTFSHQLLCGDALTVLQGLPSGIVQTCVTSPPYYGLRDYGVKGQIGLEETPDEYVAKLVAVFREVRRVLRHDGTLWLNLGDSHVGGNYRGGGIENASIKQRSNAGTLDFMATKPLIPSGYKSKDLYGIPWMVAFALRADGWYLRQEIIWHKPNCMPESVEDRPTTAHEHLFLMAKSERYYYDADAIREPLAYPDRTYGPTDTHKTLEISKQGNRTTGGLHDGRTTYTNPLGRNKRSVWSIPTQPFPESHFAVMPAKLVEPCILAGSQHGDIVLDPFIGAGTTALVALQYGRDYLGIDLNPTYLELAQRRIETIQPNMWTAGGVA